MPASFSEYFPPVSLDLSSVRASDISPHGRTGDIRKALLDILQSPRDFLRFLVVHEVALDERAKLRIGDDLLALLPLGPHADMRDVSGVFGIVLSAATLLFKLVPDAALGTLERPGYV